MITVRISSNRSWPITIDGEPIPENQGVRLSWSWQGTPKVETFYVSPHDPLSKEYGHQSLPWPVRVYYDNELKCVGGKGGPFEQLRERDISAGFGLGPTQSFGPT